MTRRRCRSIVGRAAVALAAVAVVGAGCGRDAVLDRDGAEARIRRSLASTYDIEVTAVTCPDGLEAGRGEEFRCRARLKGGTVAVDVTQTDDEGSLSVLPTHAVLVVGRVEDDIAEELADRFDRDDVEVTCPGPRLRLEAPRASFRCTAVDGDERKRVTVTVRDARGALAYALE